MLDNSLLKQKIAIPVAIDPAPFWANLFIYTYENEYMFELTSNEKVEARHFHATKPIIYILGILNDRGVFNDVYKDIYPPELQLFECSLIKFLISVVLLLFYRLHPLHR